MHNTAMGIGGPLVAKSIKGAFSAGGDQCPVLLDGKLRQLVEEGKNTDFCIHKRKEEILGLEGILHCQINNKESKNIGPLEAAVFGKLSDALTATELIAKWGQ